MHNRKTVTAYAREQPEEFYAMATQNGEAEAKEFYTAAEREKVQIEKRIKEVDNIIRCLYEDRICGRLTPKRYDVMSGGYEQEQAELRQKLISITERLSGMEMREKCIREFMDKAKSYVEMPKLTPELLQVFICRIEVYEKPEKYPPYLRKPNRDPLCVPTAGAERYARLRKCDASHTTDYLKSRNRKAKCLPVSYRSSILC